MLPQVTLLLPRFRYQADMNGVLENEMCPVFCGYADGPLRPDPAEVADAKWLPWEEFTGQVHTGELQVSPWCVQQLPALAALGPDPLRWPAANSADLPAAARP